MTLMSDRRALAWACEKASSATEMPLVNGFVSDVLSQDVEVVAMNPGAVESPFVVPPHDLPVLTATARVYCD